MSSEGHAADKAALQGFVKTRDAASSPARPAIDQQPSEVSMNLIYAWSMLVDKDSSQCAHNRAHCEESLSTNVFAYMHYHSITAHGLCNFIDTYAQVCTVCKA